jgi:hypothetical protein
MATRQISGASADDAVRRILARKEEALAYLRRATVSGSPADIEAWQCLIQRFDRQLAQYGRTWN